MQQIEAAIREGDRAASGAIALDALHQLIPI